MPTGNRQNGLAPERKGTFCAMWYSCNWPKPAPTEWWKLKPWEGQVGTAVWGRCSHAVQQENLYLLIHAPINQQSWAVAFACRMYREESIRKGWRKALINLNENRKLQPPPAGVRSGGSTAPMLSCTVSGHHSYRESTRPERGEASRSIISSPGNDSQQQYHLCMPSTSGQ